jgi:hypothetical protein
MIRSKAHHDDVKKKRALKQWRFCRTWHSVPYFVDRPPPVVLQARGPWRSRISVLVTTEAVIQSRLVSGEGDPMVVTRKRVEDLLHPHKID